MRHEDEDDEFGAQQRSTVCPNCHLPTRDYNLILCASCSKVICRRCGVRLPNGAMVCFKCSGMEKNKFERFVQKSNRTTKAFWKFWFGEWIQ